MPDGGATSLGDLPTAVQAAARRIANLATYYQMKDASGHAWAARASPTCCGESGTPRSRTFCIHLAGHSFGGRLATAAAHALPASTESR